MNIIKFIENVKEKPEHIRKRYAFLISFAFTFLITGGWIFSENIGTKAIITKEDSNGKIIETPVTSLTATAVGAFNDIKKIFKSSNKVEYNSADFIKVEAGDR